MAAKKQNPFPLKNFQGVDLEFIARLDAVGVKHASQMLAAGQTPQQRAILARKAGIPEEVVEELVRLSDLARLPGVKGIRARLYYAAGVDCVEAMAAWEPEALLAMTAAFVAQSNFPGIPPLPKEVSSTISNARMLPRLVEW